MATENYFQYNLETGEVTESEIDQNSFAIVYKKNGILRFGSLLGNFKTRNPTDYNQLLMELRLAETFDRDRVKIRLREVTGMDLSQTCMDNFIEGVRSGKIPNFDLGLEQKLEQN